MWIFILGVFVGSVTTIAVTAYLIRDLLDQSNKSH
jgi:hypothetical protein